MMTDLFAGRSERMILSCLQGHMGKVYTDSTENPRSAQIVIGSFCFYAGVPCPSLIRHIPQDSPAEMLLVPPDEAWSREIEACYGAQAQKIRRWAIKEEPEVFDPALLQSYTETLPEGCRLCKIEGALYEETQRHPWSRDLTSLFRSREDYEKRGLGFAVLSHGRLVAGASSYLIYDGGIEIEIDTDPSHRRNGFALACGARLILECLERKLYPGWDAHDARSAALAEKLGYHRDKEYITYVVTGGF